MQESARERLFDDLARLAGGTAGALSGLGRQVREEIRSRIDEAAMRLDLVPRAEFERVESMLREAREEQRRLAARLTALENGGPKKPATKKMKKMKR